MKIGSVLMVLGLASVVQAGPDIALSDVFDTWRWGNQGGITAYSIGTVVCNLGDAPAPWTSNNSNQHPVIACNFYRFLPTGRFEQIGVSWCKHGFASENNSAGLCGVCSNTNPALELYPGCSDPYDAVLNASQTLLGPRSEVNAFTGVFPFPFGIGWQQTGGPLNKRIQVPTVMMDPVQNPGIRYFADAQYVTPYEVGAARLNNTAFREFGPVTPFGDGSYVINFIDDSTLGKPGIFAWQQIDPQVVIRQVDIPSEGRLFVAYRVYHEGSNYRYEYAIYNLNSHRAVGSFRVPFADNLDASFSFTDISYHSGEIISSLNWVGARGQNGDGVSWSTESLATNANANSLRWHMLYNFTIISTSAPADTSAVIGLWRPGSPSSVLVTVAAPAIPPIQCFGDTNADNRCDGADLSVLLSSFGRQQGDPSFFAGADLNGDLIVNGSDLSIILANFGCPDQ